VQPPVECGSRDAEIRGNLSPGYLEGLHVPEDEKLFADGLSWVLPSLGGRLLVNGYLHFERIQPVFEKEDFLGLVVSIHGGQSFQISPANPPGESSRQQGSFDEK